MQGLVGESNLTPGTRRCGVERKIGYRRGRWWHEFEHAYPIVLKACIGTTPGHFVKVIVPGIMNQNRIAAFAVSYSEHGMTSQMDEYGFAGIDLLLILLVGKALGIAIVSIDILVEIVNYRISERYKELSQSEHPVVIGSRRGIGRTVTIIPKGCISVIVT